MTFPDAYEALIRDIGLATGLQDAALHMNAGLTILLLTRLVSGKRLSTMVPLAAVILAETINEIIDRSAAGSWRWPDTSSDVFYTLLWPTLISLSRWAQTHRQQSESDASLLPPGPEKERQAVLSLLTANVRPAPVIASVSVVLIVLSLAVMNNLFGIAVRLGPPRPAAALHRAASHPAPAEPAHSPCGSDRKQRPARDTESGSAQAKAHQGR